MLPPTLSSAKPSLPFTSVQSVSMKYLMASKTRVSFHSCPSELYCAHTVFWKAEINLSLPVPDPQPPRLVSSGDHNGQWFHTAVCVYQSKYAIQSPWLCREQGTIQLFRFQKWKEKKGGKKKKIKRYQEISLKSCFQDYLFKKFKNKDQFLYA